MNRRTFLRTGLGAAAILVTVRNWNGTAASGAGADEELLAQARERILKHRRGAGFIRALDTDGRPVAGIKVRIEQTRHDFLFGCNLFRFGRLKEAQLEQDYRERFAACFNFATLGFYWPYYEPVQGKPIYEYTDQVTEWCAGQGITCKGHPLVWDYADPKWLPKDFAEIRRLSEARVTDIIARYRGRIDIWDVVNEPTHLGRFGTRLGEWANSLGAVPYVTNHLKLARAANPAATLLVNDYRTDPAFYKILRELQNENSASFDCVGIQSHMHDGGWPLQRIWDVCDTYAKLGLPIHFTETTIVSGPRKGPGEDWGESDPTREASQADYVPRFYTMLFAHPSAAAITWWDFSDNGAWQGAAAGWVRKDMSPKPVFDRMADLIKREWWTREDGRTDENGYFRVSAFYGSHRVTVEQPDGRTIATDVRWERGKENGINLHLIRS